MRKSIVGLFVVALAAIAIGWALWPSKEPAAQAGAGANGPVAVEARPVVVGPIAREITAVGSLRSDESVMVRPEIAGRVESFGFDEGQKVSKGQVLVKLDATSLAAALQQAQAELELSKANAARAVNLASRGAGTVRARDEAEAKLAVDQAKVEQARAQLEKARIVAPFGGVVGLRSVSIGAYLQPGQDIVNLEAIDTMKVDFRVPEIFLPVLRPGLSVAITADAYPDRQFTGTVYAVDPAVDVNGRAILVRARIGNGEGALRPGQFVRLALKVDESLDAVSVPEEAIVPRGTKSLVFVVADGKAEPRPVKTGKRQKGMVEVTEGLKPGDVVVTAGQMKLKPGTPVTIVPQPGS
ncbi:MAG: efflux RND transporter periplasmic adaptor subunit [Pseudomonadota bacterium]